MPQPSGMEPEGLPVKTVPFDRGSAGQPDTRTLDGIRGIAPEIFSQMTYVLRTIDADEIAPPFHAGGIIARQKMSGNPPRSQILSASPGRFHFWLLSSLEDIRL